MSGTRTVWWKDKDDGYRMTRTPCLSTKDIKDEFYKELNLDNETMQVVRGWNLLRGKLW